MPTLICDCNKTMPLKAASLGAALGESLTLHSTLCRREVGDYQQAIRGGEPVVVACTQEQKLFAQVGVNTEGAVAPVHFVNIRETGGWSRDAAQAMPKIAALLAAARLPEPEPVPTVTYTSAGRLLVIGPLDAGRARGGDAVRRAGRDALRARAAPRRRSAGSRCWPAASIRSTAGWARSSSPGPPTTRSTWTCAPAAMPASRPARSRRSAWTTRSTWRAAPATAAACRVCEAAGAIDFGREAATETETFDLVLDLREQPAFAQHAPPQGYFRWDGRDLPTLLKLRDMVGEFDKPKFFSYKQKLCAHSRNEQVGCNACVEICSAEAIASNPSRQQIEVNPNLCVGCGACTTVCPTGALTYQYPRAPDQGQKLRTLLSTYLQAGGRDAALLLHGQEQGAQLVEALGRAARLEQAHGVPANVIPVALWHTASTGIDLWLSAIAFGALAGGGARHRRRGAAVRRRA